MENNYFGQFSAFSNAATESAKELETINGKIIGLLTQKNMELFNSALELNNKFVSLYGNTKDVQSLLTEQMQLTNEFNGKIVATVKEAAEIVVGSANDYQAWFEAGLKNATDTSQAFTIVPKTSRKKAA